MPFAITAAAEADHAALLELLGAQYDEHSITSEAAALSRAIRGVTTDPTRGVFLVARDDDGPSLGVAYVAFLWSLEHAGQVAWLEELYVRPAWRDRGVGRALVHAAITYASKAGCAAMDLEVDEEHARAANLYAREGFKPLRRARWVRPL